jgi:hypothetical protein
VASWYVLERGSVVGGLVCGINNLNFFFLKNTPSQGSTIVFVNLRIVDGDCRIANINRNGRRALVFRKLLGL